MFDITTLAATETSIVELVGGDDAPLFDDKGILTSTHRKYEALAASSGVSPSTDPAKWLDLGPTNRWAMFDARVGAAT